MWIHAIEAGKQFKLPPGAVFRIIAAYQRIDDSIQPESRQLGNSRCPAGHWEPGLGPCICEGKVHSA